MKDESDGVSGDEEYGEEFDSGKDESDHNFVFNDLDEKSNSWQTIQFISDDQVCEVVVLGSWDVSINIDVNCLHTVTLAFCGGLHRRGGTMKRPPPMKGGGGGGHKPHCML